MTTLIFTLSMPNVGSWNGKWSGRENVYAIIRPTGTALANAILAKGSFYYNFGDGWGASISVKKAEAGEARKVRAKSKGFCGYDWMVASIVQHGKIYSELRPKPADAPPWPPALPIAPQPRVPSVPSILDSEVLF